VKLTVGAFQGPQNPAQPSGLRNHLDYEERSVLCTLNQLLGNGWSIGARYRLSQAEYTDDFVDVPNGIVYRNFVPHKDEEALLHELSLDALNNRDAASLADDEFWQINFLAGYRFPRRKAEITLGVLNLTDQDYRLNPLTPYQELPRDRTLIVRLQINF
jgi:outer membrane receptor protein involved in Fe transport